LKGTGLVNSGPTAAATSKPIKLESGDSVKGLFLTKRSPQHIVDRVVDTGEKKVVQEIQWLASFSRPEA
jgi:hypothetical protein